MNFLTSFFYGIIKLPKPLNIIEVRSKKNRIKSKIKDVEFEDFIENKDLQEIIEYNLMITGG